MVWTPTSPATNDPASSSVFRTNWGHIEQSLFGVNLIQDNAFILWPGETVNTGTAQGLAHWTASGTGALIQRCGTGLTDTTRKFGAFCAKLTYGSASAFLLQTILAATMDDSFRSKTISAGGWVWASSASQARLQIGDGVGTTFSSYHTGNSTWQWLTLTRSLNAAATLINSGLTVESAGAAFLSGHTVHAGEIPPVKPIASLCQFGFYYFQSPGGLTTGTYKGSITPARPGRIADAFLRVGTAPTGAALLVDINSYDGSALTTAFTTKPTVAISALAGVQAPDGAYARRCLSGTSSTTRKAGDEVSWDIDQIGSTIAGSDLYGHVRVLQFVPPLGQFQVVSEFG